MSDIPLMPERNPEGKTAGSAGPPPPAAAPASAAAPAPAQAPAPVPAPLAAAPADGGERFDPAQVPAILFRILRDPMHGVAAHHRAGRAAMVLGLALGGACAVLVPFSDLLFRSLRADGPSFGDLVRSIAGGALLLVFGPLLGLVLRATAGKVQNVDWRDDLYLLGAALVFVLAGALAGGLAGFLWLRLGDAFRVAGFVLAAFAHASALATVGQVDSRRAIWFSTALLAAAALVYA